MLYSQSRQEGWFYVASSTTSYLSESHAAELSFAGHYSFVCLNNTQSSLQGPQVSRRLPLLRSLANKLTFRRRQQTAILVLAFVRTWNQTYVAFTELLIYLLFHRLIDWFSQEFTVLYAYILIPSALHWYNYTPVRFLVYWLIHFHSNFTDSLCFCSLFSLVFQPRFCANFYHPMRATWSEYLIHLTLIVLKNWWIKIMNLLICIFVQSSVFSSLLVPASHGMCGSWPASSSQ